MNSNGYKPDEDAPAPAGPGLTQAPSPIWRWAKRFLAGNPTILVSSIFLLLRTVRWQDEEHRGAAGLRIFAAATWIVHAFVWTRADGTSAGWVVPSTAALVLGIYIVARLVTGRWGALVVPAGAALSFLAAPANFLVDKIRTSPAGLPAIAGSFLLFGLGTIVALTKRRWNPPPQSGHDQSI